MYLAALSGVSSLAESYIANQFCDAKKLSNRVSLRKIIYSLISQSKTWEAAFSLCANIGNF